MASEGVADVLDAVCAEALGRFYTVTHASQMDFGARLRAIIGKANRFWHM